MKNTNSQSLYHILNIALSHQEVGLTAAELHGLISGILCGGKSDNSWSTLVYELTNDGIAFSSELNQQTQKLYHLTKEALEDSDLTFQLLIDEETTIYNQIDDLVGWVNHFLLGLGLVVPTFGSLNGEMKELIEDFRSIGNLGYDEEDSPEEMESALTEITEYVRMGAIMCYNEFNLNQPSVEEPVLH